MAMAIGTEVYKGFIGLAHKIVSNLFHIIVYELQRKVTHGQDIGIVYGC